MGKTAAEIKSEIAQASRNIPNSGIETEDYDTPAYYNPPIEEEEGEAEEIEQKPFFQTEDEDDDPMVEWVRQRREEKEEKLRKQAEWEGLPIEEKFRHRQNFGKPDFVEENQNQPQVSQQDAQAVWHDLESDFLALRDRYGGIVDEFQRDFRIGKFKIPPSVLSGKIENPLEYTLRWVWAENPGVLKTIPIKEIKQIVNKYNEGPMLRSRAQDRLIPERVRPKKSTKRKEQTFKMPNITGDRMVAMVSEYYRRHPEAWEEDTK